MWFFLWGEGVGVCFFFGLRDSGPVEQDPCRHLATPPQPLGTSSRRSGAKPSGVVATRPAPVPVPGCGASLGGSAAAAAGEASRAVVVPCERGEGHGAAGGVRRRGAGPLPPSPSRCSRGRGVAAVSPR